VNALKMMESISILLFKPGFTVQEVPDGLDLQYFGMLYNLCQYLIGIDEQLVWKSGISIPEAPNHYNNNYNPVRIALLRLLIIMLSQPLFYGPDEYLLVLNPFSTYFTSRRAKNTKNLFVSLVNTVLSYDC
jgi:hypothetical protein